MSKFVSNVCLSLFAVLRYSEFIQKGVLECVLLKNFNS